MQLPKKDSVNLVAKLNSPPSKYNPPGYMTASEMQDWFETGMKTYISTTKALNDFKNRYARRKDSRLFGSPSSVDPQNPKGGRPNKKDLKARKGDGKDGLKPFYPTKEPKSSEVTLVTGINSGTLVDPFRNSSSSNGSLLYTLSGSVFPCHVWKSDSLVKKLIKSDIYFKIITTVQATVHYRSDRDLTPEKLFKIVCNQSEGLQLYYLVDAILTFDLSSDNLNSGMRSLRSMLSSEILSQHERLRRVLLDCAIVPNLMTFICFMYQNFRYIDCPNSPIFRLSYEGALHANSTGALSVKLYDDIINKLTSETRVNALLHRAYPITKLTELKPSSPKPIYDPNWLTFWYNSCVTYVNKSDGHLTYTRSVDSNDQDLYYGEFTKNSVDGIFYACSSIYHTGTKTLESGLFSPISDIDVLTSSGNTENQSSLLCHTGSGTFKAPTSIKTLSQAGIFHGVYHTDNTPSKFVSQALVSPDAQQVQTHSINHLGQAVSASVMFIFSGLVD